MYILLFWQYNTGKGRGNCLYDHPIFLICYPHNFHNLFIRRPPDILVFPTLYLVRAGYSSYATHACTFAQISHAFCFDGAVHIYSK